MCIGGEVFFVSMVLKILILIVGKVCSGCLFLNKMFVCEKLLEIGRVKNELGEFNKFFFY